MPQMICALGDLLLDVVVRLDAPIAEDTDTYGRTRVGAGGQAANVAAWVAELGGHARFVGKRARDAAGQIVAAELEAHSVDLSGTVALEQAGVQFVRDVIEEHPVSVVFANEAEMLLLGPVHTAATVLKRGAKGIVIRTGSETRELPAHETEAVDTTGAGDAFAAGYLLGGAEVGLRAAARCVRRMGTMP